MRMAGSALIDGPYRYTLLRTWNARLPKACWIMLNPSTADAQKDDPTIRKVIGFSSRWGFGSIVVVNLFPLRATDPSELAKHSRPEGDPEKNLAVVQEAMEVSARTYAAWGAHQVATVQAMSLGLTRSMDLWCLGVTKDGHPKHPLYVSYDTKPEGWVCGRVA